MAGWDRMLSRTEHHILDLQKENKKLKSRVRLLESKVFKLRKQIGKTL